MKVFKFGGASVKDAEGVKNILSVLKTKEEKDLVVIVSAMGKMTNQLELLVDHYFTKPSHVGASIIQVYDFHYQISSDLFKNTSHPIFNLLIKYKN
jgi:aspartate kinase